MGPTSGPQKSRENTTERTRAPSVAEDEYDLEDEPLVKRIKPPKSSKPSLSKPSTSEPSLYEPTEKKTSSPSKKQNKSLPLPSPPTIKETSSGNLRHYRKPSKPMVKKSPENNEPPSLASSISKPSNSDPSLSKPSTSEPSLSKPSTSEPSVLKPSLSKPSTSEPSLYKPSTSEPPTSKTLLLNLLLLSKSSSNKNTKVKEADTDATVKPSVSKPSISIPSTSEPSLLKPSTSEVKEVDTEAAIKVSKRVIEEVEEDEDIPLAKKFKLSKPRLPLVIKNLVERQLGSSISKNAKEMKLKPKKDTHLSSSEGAHSSKLTNKNKPRLPLVMKHPVEEQPGTSIPKNAKDNRDAHPSFSEGVHSNKQTTNNPSIPRPPPVPSLPPTTSDKIIPGVKEVSTTADAVAPLPLQSPVKSVSGRPDRKCKTTDSYYDLESDVLLYEGPEVKEVSKTNAVAALPVQSPVKSVSGRPDRKCKTTDPYYELESDVLLDEGPEVKEVPTTANVVVPLPVQTPVKSVSGRPDRKCKTTD